MKLTARDRKIMIFIGVAALVAAYWFLLLSPKFGEKTKVNNDLTQAQSARDTAAARLSQLSAAKRSFADDYKTVIRLGQSIPATLDMPSLLDQLWSAARGTNISFTSVTSGNRSAAPSSSSTPTPSTSQPSTSGSSTSNASSSSGIPGLDSVPLTFEFDGPFFRLADFFHQMKRFVQVANGQILVSGRLMTINSFSFKTIQQNSAPDPNAPVLISANVQATVYLAPKAQGLTAGATAQGPAGTAPSAPATPASTPGASPTAATAALTR